MLNRNRSSVKIGTYLACITRILVLSFLIPDWELIFGFNSLVLFFNYFVFDYFLRGKAEQSVAIW